MKANKTNGVLLCFSSEKCMSSIFHSPFCFAQILVASSVVGSLLPLFRAVVIASFVHYYNRAKKRHSKVSLAYFPARKKRHWRCCNWRSRTFICAAPREESLDQHLRFESTDCNSEPRRWETTTVKSDRRDVDIHRGVVQSSPRYARCVTLSVPRSMLKPSHRSATMQARW